MCTLPFTRRWSVLSGLTSSASPLSLPSLLRSLSVLEEGSWPSRSTIGRNPLLLFLLLLPTFVARPLGLLLLCRFQQDTLLAAQTATAVISAGNALKQGGFFIARTFAKSTATSTFRLPLLYIPEAQWPSSTSVTHSICRTPGFLTDRVHQ